MKGFVSYGVKYFIGAGVVGSLLLTQGCIATRDWVKVKTAAWKEANRWRAEVFEKGGSRGRV